MLKKNDFIEVEYTGSIKEDNAVFDTTSEIVAREHGIFSEKMKYGPVVICLGQRQIIPGLDKALEGKETGKEYNISVTAEDAFGKKDARMVQLIAINKFKKANIQPMPGLQVNIDGQVGVIRTVSGGRTLVDFNHPLSGKEVVYTITVKKIVTDDAKKVSSFLGGMLHLDEPEVTVADGHAKVTLPFEMPKEVTDALEKKLLEILPSVKKLDFVKKEEKKDEKKEVKADTKKEEQHEANAEKKETAKHDLHTRSM